MARLSVILITKNEAANIRACLDSVAWADEIIVVDSGSTDGTTAIARDFTQHVYEHDWPGFGPQKNRALDYATGEWVLSLDADERVTPELRAEITAVLASPRAEGYRIPRLSSFCGRFMHHSGWRPDYVLRLFRRDKGRFSDALVHEAVQVHGRVEDLKHDLLHFSYRDFDDVLAKLNGYSSAGSEMLQRRGKRGGLASALFHGLWAFIRTYFLRAGFLDGREGFMVAIMNAENSYYRYIKLWLKQRH
ncbi:glycosyl transferase family 2 [Ferrigenium kumadai]|uniref:Glycosyl transferase family 2 n=1 Tax=Ferrigenium kumadai TaxID=1682490 RepID=A0AAN1T189_9PROT|nr:glycosyltransferase family 2 protein [Ferrigenium kumadai]BBJ00628.1 glycosyl transferase family 2 [Ferrigenium kumadai]